MKKILLLGLGLGLALFFLNVSGVDAAVSVSVNIGPELSAEDAKMLKQALDILGTVLDDLDARIDAAPSAVKDPVAAKAALGDIRGTLVGIDATLRSSAIAKTPVNPSAEVAKSPAGEDDSSSLGAVIAPEAGGDDAAPQTASVIDALSSKKLFGGLAALVLLMGAAVIWRRRFRVRSEATEAL